MIPAGVDVMIAAGIKVEAKSMQVLATDLTMHDMLTQGLKLWRHLRRCSVVRHGDAIEKAASV